MTLHTDRRYEEELAGLRQRILNMGGLVERQIGDAIIALTERDRPLAEAAIERDHEVNRYDVEIDEECLRILALHQPAARDLRFIVTALRITTDLERIADLAVNICERALELREGQSALQLELPRMADSARQMLRECLDAFVREDAELALSVCQEDDQVDRMHAQMLDAVLAMMADNPSMVVDGTLQLFVSKYLERIADHTTNIAEMVIFMAKGKSIRHLSRVPDSV